MPLAVVDDADVVLKTTTIPDEKFASAIAPGGIDKGAAAPVATTPLVRTGAGTGRLNSQVPVDKLVVVVVLKN